jgi:hypothetical protein
MSTTPEAPIETEIPLELVLSQLSERGKMEWELAVTKAQLLATQSRASELQEQVDSLLADKS